MGANMAWWKTKIGGWIAGVAIASDELGNAIGGDNPRETISAHCGYQMLAGKPCRFCRIICKVCAVLFRNPSHCTDAAIAEKNMLASGTNLIDGTKK